MSSLYAVMALVLLFACVFVLVPFIRFKKANKQSEVTSSWYLSRKQELQAELSEGRFDEQEYQAAIAELQETAKQELKIALEEKQVEEALDSKPYLFAALALMLVTSIVFYSQNGHYNKLEQWQDTMAAMPELSQKIIQDSNAPVTNQELQDFALGLRTKLLEKDEAIGWMLLGRTLMAMSDIDGAISAFQKSYERQPSNVSNTLSYGQALQQSGDDILIEKSLRLFSEVLTYRPDNAMASLLLGESSLLLERFEGAKTAFTYGLSLLEENDPRRSLVSQRLQVINQQMGLSSVAFSGLTIEIDIASELKTKLNQFNNLFVFAKLSSMPMPIAVKKLSVSEFPLVVTLSDADAMVPELTLSSQQQVQVYARLSVDDQAPWSLGDWQGQQSNIDVNNTDVIKITIAEENK